MKKLMKLKFYLGSGCTSRWRERGTCHSDTERDSRLLSLTGKRVELVEVVVVALAVVNYHVCSLLGIQTNLSSWGEEKWKQTF